jgi:hypothetical protein
MGSPTCCQPTSRRYAPHSHHAPSRLPLCSTRFASSEACLSQTAWMATGSCVCAQVVFVLQRRGEVVGLTGHGCHDSAAMAQANVAIATHGAHEAARCIQEKVET